LDVPTPNIVIYSWAVFFAFVIIFYTYLRFIKKTTLYQDGCKKLRLKPHKLE